MTIIPFPSKGGRPPIYRACPQCGEVLTATERRVHHCRSCNICGGLDSARHRQECAVLNWEYWPLETVLESRS
jgi:hypothetical protein